MPSSMKRLTRSYRQHGHFGSMISFIEKNVAMPQGCTEDEDHLQTTLGRGVRVEPDRELSWGEHLLEHPYFKHFIDFVVVLNVCQMGLSLDLRGDTWDAVWVVLDIVVLTIFSLEMIMNLGVQGLSYFQKRMNIIDFIVVLVSMFDAFMMQFNPSSRYSLIQILRLLRLVRIAKLLKVFPAFKVILDSMHASFITISWFILFLCIIIYVVAVACVMLFGARDSGYPGYNTDQRELKNAELAEFNNFRYFGTIWRATLTLFNLTLLTDVSQVLRPINEVQPWATIFFSLFILVMTLCILNSIVGVVVQKTVAAIITNEQAQCKVKKHQMDALEKLADLMFDLDVDGNSELSLNELRAGSKDPRLHKLLRLIDLPVGFTIEELFSLLDVDGSGILSRAEFIGGMFRLIFSNEFQRGCLTQLGETQLKRCIWTVRDEILQDIRHEHHRLLNEIRELVDPVRPAATGDHTRVTSADRASNNGSQTPHATCDSTSSTCYCFTSEDRRARVDAYLAAADHLPDLRLRLERTAINVRSTAEKIATAVRNVSLNSSQAGESNPSNELDARSPYLISSSKLSKSPSQLTHMDGQGQSVDMSSSPPCEHRGLNSSSLPADTEHDRSPVVLERISLGPQADSRCLPEADFRMPPCPHEIPTQTRSSSTKSFKGLGFSSETIR